MATAMTRFEVQIPLTDATQAAVAQFYTSMQTLCDVINNNQYVQKMNNTSVYTALLYGVITAAQQATALGYLNTLNASLNAAGLANVLCIAWNVTSQP